MDATAPSAEPVVQRAAQGATPVIKISALAVQKGYRKPGTVRNDLVNTLDITATTLALCGVPLPAVVEGRPLFAADHPPRDHVIGARDRCDYTIDRIRTVRSAGYALDVEAAA